VAARELRAGEARAGEDGAARARIESLWGAVFSAEGRVHEAADRYERAFALADAAGERHAAASFLVNVGLGRLEQGQAGPAIEALREGARRLTELGRRRDAARALYNLGNAAALVGDDDLAADAIRRASVWAEELGDGPAMAYAAVVAAELAVRAGKPNRAASGFASGIIREPLAGMAADLPVGRDLRMHLASPAKALDYTLTAIALAQSDLGLETTVTLPGISVTVGAMLTALEALAGSEVAARVTEQPDAAIERIVTTWPGQIITPRAEALGFAPNRDFSEIVCEYMESLTTD